jgi:drug/metabolite transporter (DMT)-like permease
MSPAIVAFLSYLIFGERLSLKKIMGLCLATLGSSVLFWHDFTSLGNWKGAAFALLGALMFAVYLLSGRKIRQERSTLEYIYPTYAIAAAVLFLLTLIADVPLIGFSGKTYLFLLLLWLIPQCLGHTSCNWALKYLSATVVSTLVLTEPILATLLAWLILGEGVGPIVLLGACLVGSGILIVSQGEISKKESSGAEIKEARNRTRRN